jgi:hypothetical protein
VVLALDPLALLIAGICGPTLPVLPVLTRAGGGTETDREPDNAVVDGFDVVTGAMTFVAALA